MRLPRRFPQPIREALWLTLIGAMVGAAYGHMVNVSNGRPLLGFDGIPRGVLVVVLIASILSFFRHGLEQPAMASLRRLPFLAYLALKRVSTLTSCVTVRLKNLRRVLAAGKCQSLSDL
jgi:hypothetical protein